MGTGSNEKRETLIFPRHAVPPPAPTDGDVDAGWDVIAAESLASADLIASDTDPTPVWSNDRPTVPASLSSSDLESDRSLATTRPPPPPPIQEELSVALEARTPTAPPVSLEPQSGLAEPARSFGLSHAPRLPWLRRRAAVLVASHVAAAAVAAVVVVSLRAPAVAPAPPRQPHTAAGVRAGFSTLAAPDRASPLEGCILQETARVIATRAELGPGLDARTLEDGFGVGLAVRPTEAAAVRLDAKTLRTTETLRVRSPWPLARLAVDRGDDERLDLRLDPNDARTIAPSQRVFARGGAVFTMTDTGRTRMLWALPGPAPRTPETLRAAVRPDGATLVAVRRHATLWVGITGGGAMTSLARSGKTIGAPALAPATENGGGVIAWAERDATGPFRIMATSFVSDGTFTTSGAAEAITEGLSPALAPLPSGELLLAYAAGGTGAHRVVVQRLGPDLGPRGEAIVVSGDGANAGQPALAVDAGGRVMVAFLVAEHGAAEVQAAALECH